MAVLNNVNYCVHSWFRCNINPESYTQVRLKKTAPQWAWSSILMIMLDWQPCVQAFNPATSNLCYLSLTWPLRLFGQG